MRLIPERRGSYPGETMSLKQLTSAVRKQFRSSSSGKSRRQRSPALPANRRYRSRLSLEPLEEIVLLNGTVSWINAAGGDWGLASNWRDQNGLSRLPGATDDVIIDVPGNVSVTHALNAV